MKIEPFEQELLELIGPVEIGRRIGLSPQTVMHRLSRAEFAPDFAEIAASRVTPLFRAERWKKMQPILSGDLRKVRNQTMTP